MDTPNLSAVNLTWRAFPALGDTPALNAVNLSWAAPEETTAGFISAVFGAPTLSLGVLQQTTIQPNGFATSAFGPAEVTQPAYVPPIEVSPPGIKSTVFGQPSLPKILNSAIRPDAFRRTGVGLSGLGLSMDLGGFAGSAVWPPSLELNLSSNAAPSGTTVTDADLRLSFTPASTAWLGQISQAELKEISHC